MPWVLITPVTERGCMSEVDYEKWDSAAYKVLYIHGCFAQQHIEVEKRFEEDADAATIREYLARSRANVLACGHGWDNLTTANNCEIWLKADELPDWVKDRVFVLLSCLTGKELGPALVEKGAKAFFGLYDIGLLPALPEAAYCRYFYAPLIGLIEAAVSIELGYSVEEAARRAIERWENEIHYWMNFYDEQKIKLEDRSEVPVDDNLAQLLITCLAWNRDVFVAYPVGAGAAEATRIAAAIAGAGAVIGLAWLLSRYPTIAPSTPSPVPD